MFEVTYHVRDNRILHSHWPSSRNVRRYKNEDYIYYVIKSHTQVFIKFPFVRASNGSIARVCWTPAKSLSRFHFEASAKRRVSFTRSLKRFQSWNLGGRWRRWADYNDCSWCASKRETGACRCKHSAGIWSAASCRTHTRGVCAARGTICRSCGIWGIRRYPVTRSCPPSHLIWHGIGAGDRWWWWARCRGSRSDCREL